MKTQPQRSDVENEVYDGLVRDAMLWRAQEMHKMQPPATDAQLKLHSVTMTRTPEEQAEIESGVHAEQHREQFTDDQGQVWEELKPQQPPDTDDKQWTPETVRDFWRENQRKELQDDQQWNTFFTIVADAHNAELESVENAEVQRLRDLAMEIQDLKREIATLKSDAKTDRASDEK